MFVQSKCSAKHGYEMFAIKKPDIQDVCLEIYQRKIYNYNDSYVFTKPFEETTFNI